jgi:hypothetical protein
MSKAELPQLDMRGGISYDKKNPKFPKGLYSGIKDNVIELTPKALRRHYAESCSKEYWERFESVKVAYIIY